MAQPHRRLVLDPVRERTRSVGDLIGELDLGQPGVSKHLKVLRVAGRERHLDPGAIP